MEISVIVMTSTFWPVSDSSPSCIYPDIMVKSSESFKQFYLSRHSGRRLTWQPAMGNADVRVHFREKSHELNVSTHCLVILLLFEDLGESDFLTYQVSQRSLPPIAYYSRIFAGDQSSYRNPGSGATTILTVSSVCKVQDSEETSPGQGRQSFRFLLV